MTSKNIDLPKVSVILTTFNREYFFTEAIESILEQDYPNLEIIISDDGSSDNTFAFACEYAQDHPNIKVVQNAHSKGSAGNRNNGLDYANGDLVLLLDDDDLLFKEAISQMVEVYLQFNKHYGIILANCTRSDDGFLSGKGINETREVCFYLHRPLKFYRIHAESLTHNMKYKPLEMVKNYEQDILLFYKERKELCPKYLAELCATAALLYRQGGDNKHAFKKILQSLLIYPNLKALKALVYLFLPKSFIPRFNVRQRIEK